MGGMEELVRCFKDYLKVTQINMYKVLDFLPSITNQSTNKQTTKIV